VPSCRKRFRAGCFCSVGLVVRGASNSSGVIERSGDTTFARRARELLTAATKACRLAFGSRTGLKQADQGRYAARPGYEARG